MIPLGEDRPTAPPRRPSGRAVCKTEGKSGAATPRDGLHERNPSPGTAATAQKTCSYATQSPHDGCPERSALVLTAGALSLRPFKPRRCEGFLFGRQPAISSGCTQ